MPRGAKARSRFEGAPRQDPQAREQLRQLALAAIGHPGYSDDLAPADRKVDLPEGADIVVTGAQAVLSEELKGQTQVAGDADDD